MTKDRIFTTKEQGRLLLEAGLPLSTAVGYRPRMMDKLSCMKDQEGPVSLIEAVTPDVQCPVWDVTTLMNLLPEEIEGRILSIHKISDKWFMGYIECDMSIPHKYLASDTSLIDTVVSMILELIQDGYIILKI